MSEISHHHDDKGDDPFNYSHDTCPTCQDLLIVESDVEGCDNASSANPVILVALNVSADGMKSKRWWKVFWRWFHSHKNEGWRHYGVVKGPQSSLQVFNQSLLWTIGKGCLDGTSWLLFEGGLIHIEKSIQTKSKLASNLFPEVLNLVVISLFDYFHSIQQNIILRCT